METRHATPTAPAHTRARASVRCTSVKELPPEVEKDLAAARNTKAEIEKLEALARAKRAELDALLARIVGNGVAKREVARRMEYASDNSVRVKTRRHR